ncbi:hypothetical protein ACWGCC_40975, partial [Streptomyces nigrescens]
ITCFSVAGHTHQQVVDHAAAHRVRLSTSTYTCIGTAVINTPAEVDTALNSLADLAQQPGHQQGGLVKGLIGQVHAVHPDRLQLRKPFDPTTPEASAPATGDQDG